MGRHLHNALNSVSVWKRAPSLITTINNRSATYLSSATQQSMNCPGNVLLTKDDSAILVWTPHQLECSRPESIACPNEDDTESSIILGNLNTVGTRKSLICKPGFALDGLQTKECLQTGAGSETGTCRSVCPNMAFKSTPTKVSAIAIPTSSGIQTFASKEDVNLPLFEGSNITVQCVNETKSLHNTTTCIEGNWTLFQECFSQPGDSCETSSDCFTENMVCSKGRCLCQEWLFYDPCAKVCVAECPDGYGDTYQVREGQVILGYNVVQRGRLQNMYECMDVCTSATSYTCKYADYWTNRKLCNLNKNIDVYSMNPLENDNCLLLQPNCKFCPP